MIPGSAFTRRLEELRRAIGREGLGGAVLVPGPNMKYFTGVDSLMLERPFMLLVPAGGAARLVAPAIEAGPYSRSGLEIDVHPWTDSEGPSAALEEAARGAGVGGAWGVEGRTPYLYLDALLRHARPELKSAEQMLQGIREVKDEFEVGLLKKSASVLGRAFERFPALVEEGRTEQDVARAAADAIYAEGATKVDDVLVQSGPRSADPHALPSNRKLARGDGVVVDVGATFEGYYADITRTFSLGGSKQVEEVYLAVLEAQESGIDAAAEGVSVGEVDRAARDVLKKAGLGKEFIHRTGHGLGLEIHEAPYIVEGGKEKLRSGMCFTVEPGAYLAGKLGVRIEDDVLVEGKRGTAITSPPKEFGWWI